MLVSPVAVAVAAVVVAAVVVVVAVVIVVVVVIVPMRCVFVGWAREQSSEQGLCVGMSSSQRGV
jgi:hypothetical protein